MSAVDPRLESLVRAELHRRGRPSGARVGRPNWPRALARSIHRGECGLLEHLQRVADAVPDICRPVAWLHHASDGRPQAGELLAVDLSADQSEALRLLALPAGVDQRTAPVQMAQALARVPGSAGEIARVVAQAALLDARVGDWVRGEGRTGIDGHNFAGAT